MMMDDDMSDRPEFGQRSAEDQGSQHCAVRHTCNTWLGRLQAEAEVERLREMRQRGCDCNDEDACRFARERDEARAEVERLKAERDAAYRAGQEAMRERCAALCDDWEAINYCDEWMAMELGAQQCAEAIRALEVEL
jgi:hypothetical protein